MANPGNPSGLFRNAEDCLDLMRGRPNLLWIIDEAFIEYAGPEEEVSVLRRLPANGAVLRSLTKFHAVPGVRLGYLAASPDVAEAVRAEIPAWSVNAFALAAALAVFADRSDFADRTRAENDERRADLAAALAALPGVEVYPSAANYLLFRWPHPIPLGSILLKQFGIALRDCSNYHGLGKGWFRAAVRFPEDHRRLADALRAVLETPAASFLSSNASPFPGQDDLVANGRDVALSNVPQYQNDGLSRFPQNRADNLLFPESQSGGLLHFPETQTDTLSVFPKPHSDDLSHFPHNADNGLSAFPENQSAASSPLHEETRADASPDLADRDSIKSKVLGKRGDGGPGEGERTTLLQKGFLSPSPGGSALTSALLSSPHPRRTPALMLQGTSSNAGKSVLAAAFCRIFRQDGYDVAPFKAQNMSLNSGVTARGDEMGRAQIVQAQAARVDPDARMNPILLKPHSDTGSQVVVLGQPAGHMGVLEYFQKKRDLWPTVRQAYDELAASHDIMVLEGAGSPGEINLKSHHLVNMRMAEYAGASVLLVGDIDRGGVYASFLGTWMTFSGPERRLLTGYLVNRFRGDASLLGPAHQYMLDCTGAPVLGTIPHIRDLNLPEEDMAGFPWGGRPQDGPKEPGTLDIAVVMLRHVSNYTDFAPLGLEPDVRLRPVRRLEDWGEPDVVMLPGSKSVVPDLDDLRRSGLADRILEHGARGKWLFGICGGLQVLGRDILDPYGVESSAPHTPGLGLMDLRSTFAADKTLVRVTRAETPLGVLSSGYEIHHGQTEHGPSARPLFLRADRAYADPAERVCGYADGRRWATYLHGIFDDDAFRRAWLDHVRADIGLKPQGRILASYDIEKALDRLADIVRESCDLTTIYQSMGL
ncbi:MAG: cobyric acid synthase [Bilophila sp.]